MKGKSKKCPSPLCNCISGCIVDNAILDERKACAQIAREHERRALKAGSSVAAGYCLDIESAIRSRGETKE